MLMPGLNQSRRRFLSFTQLLETVMDTKLDDNKALTPVVIVTGFLGAGKTTFLNRLLRYSAERGLQVAVLENEIGELGIDDRLLDDAAEVLTATGGCFCHTVRGDVSDFLLKLASRKFDLVVIETTGRADPEPVRRIIAHDERLKHLYSLNGILTLVDARHLLLHINDRECRAQIAAADWLAINKIELSAGQDVAAIERRVREINPLLAKIWTMRYGEVIASGNENVNEIFGLLMVPANNSQPRSSAHASVDPGVNQDGDDHMHDDDHEHSDEHAHDDEHAHGDEVTAVSIKVDGALDKNKFDLWVQRRRLEGNDIFRAKGLVAIAGQGMMVVHGVHYDWTVKLWSDEQTETSFVLIGRNLDGSALSKALNDCRADNSEAKTMPSLDVRQRLAAKPDVNRAITFVPAPYEPPQFYSPPDDCPICPARAAMQEAFEQHGAVIEQYEVALDELPFAGGLDKDALLSVRRLLRQYNLSFTNMVTAYYRSFVLNQAIYYLFETYGSLRGDREDAVVALAAYEQYQNNACQAIAEMRSALKAELKPACELLKAAPDSPAGEAFASLLKSDARLQRSIEDCWVAMTSVYTDPRKERVLTVF
jgi:G3E family GTPase